MGIVQLAESQGATHAKTTSTRSRSRPNPARGFNTDLEAGLNINQACRKAGITPTTYYRWKVTSGEPSLT